jgi:predicted nucleic acid-binding Zn finger protein
MFNSTTTAQARRTQRAQAEADAYQILPAVTAGVGHGVTYWVVSPSKQRIYLVAGGTCTCADFAHRGRRADGSLTGLRCKHIEMVAEQIHLTDEIPSDEPEPVSAFAATNADANHQARAATARAQALADRALLWD